MTNAELGYLGFYNAELGLSPFERYFVGGDGIAQFQLDGRETVGLRGYENNRLSSIAGGTIYNKIHIRNKVCAKFKSKFNYVCFRIFRSW